MCNNIHVFPFFPRHSFVSTWLHCITFGKATSTENHNQLLYIPYTILYMKNLCWVPFWRCVFSRLHGCLDWPGVQLWHQQKWLLPFLDDWFQQRHGASPGRGQPAEVLRRPWFSNPKTVQRDQKILLCKKTQYCRKQAQWTICFISTVA